MKHRIIMLNPKNLSPVSRPLSCFLWLTSLLLLLFACQPVQPVQQAPTARHGTLDLRNWPLSQKGPTQLKGEWLFNWSSQPENIRTMSVPGRWENNRKLPLWKSIYGTGIYRLKLQFSPLDQGQVLQLQTSFISSSFRCALNQKPIGWSGLRSDGQAEASRINRFTPFVVTTLSAVLECQVSNRVFHRGGLIEPLWIGETKTLLQREQRTQPFNFVVVGFLLLMAFYHLVLWVLRPQEKLKLWFALFMFSAVVYYDLLQTHLFENLLQASDFSLTLTLLRTGLYVSDIFIALYLREVFAEESSDRMVNILIALLVPLILVTLFFPARIHTLTLLPFWGIHLLEMFYALFVMVLASLHRRKGALLFSLGMGANVLISLHDIAFYMGFTGSGGYPLGIYGYLIFGLSQSMLLAQRFNETFLNSERLSDELRQLNHTLEDRVAWRTRDLAESHGKIQAMTQSQQALMQMIVHDLKNPLSVILEQKRPTSEAWQTIQLAGRQMQHMILNLLDLAVAREQGLKPRCRPVSALELIGEALDEMSIQLNRKHLALQNQIPGNLQLYCDPALIRRVLVNLLSNAIKYAPLASTLTFDHCMHEGGLEITLADQGPGLPPTTVRPAFRGTSPLESPTAPETLATGRGLEFCRLALQAHEGWLGLENLEESGCIARLYLPFAPSETTDSESALST
jgi:two-component system sensor histidine kinase ChiS